MITVTQAAQELRKLLPTFRTGTDLSVIVHSGGMMQMDGEVVLSWDNVELKSEAVMGGYALFLVRCDGLQTSGIFADLGAAVAEFKRQCGLWEGQ